MKLFDINNPLMQSLTKICDLILLNILFILCCLPIVTIGPAVTALYSVMLKLIRDEEGSVIKDFFRALGSNFKQSIVIHLLFLLIGFVLVADVFFVFYAVEDHGAMTYILLGFSGVLALLAGMTLLYVYPLLARFENSTRNTVQLALILAFRHWPTTLVLAFLSVLPILIMLIPNEVVIGFVYLMVIIGFSAQTMAQSFFLRRVFDQYVPKNSENSTQGVHT